MSVADVARAAFGIEFTTRSRRRPRDTTSKRGTRRCSAAQVRTSRIPHECSPASPRSSRANDARVTAVKLAVSNIAWDSNDDDAAAALLVREGVSGIEIAPTKWRPAPFDASAADVADLRARWEDRGLPIVSLQSLLFGRPELQLFAGDPERQALARSSAPSHRLRAPRSARQRWCSGRRRIVCAARDRSTRRCTSRATSFARSFAHARDRGVVFCIEANPPAYGCDFVTTTSEAVELCRLTDDSSGFASTRTSAG